MTEKIMQKLFTKQLQQTPPDRAEVYELKICKLKSLPFSKVEVHQKKALMRSFRKDGFYYKIPDIPASWYMQYGSRFVPQKPFDCFYLRDIAAFVVVWFYHPREQKIFYKIPIEDFYLEEVNSPRKSITEERVKQIGTPIVITVKL